MEEPYGKIVEKGTMYLREAVGTATLTNAETGETFRVDLFVQLGARSPIVICEETGKTFILPWRHILAMAGNAGIGEKEEQHQEAV